LTFNSKLLADLLQICGAGVQLLYGPLDALETQNERSDVVKRSTGSGSPNDDFNTICSGLVLIVLASTAILALFTSVRRCVSSSSSLLVVISLASFVGAFTAAHLQRDVDLFSYSVPNGVHAVSVVQPLKDSIATNHDEVEVILYFEAFDVRVAHNDVGIATKAWPLGFNVSECL